MELLAGSDFPSNRSDLIWKSFSLVASQFRTCSTLDRGRHSCHVPFRKANPKSDRHVILFSPFLLTSYFTWSPAWATYDDGPRRRAIGVHGGGAKCHKVALGTVRCVLPPGQYRVHVGDAARAPWFKRIRRGRRRRWGRLIPLDRFPVPRRRLCHLRRYPARDAS